ncbi:hypothetical protein P2W68_16290 [Chryseobacterium arthrosphaerae]|uniref:glycine-rich domain-containing protein n=1 Tax=Chryseobacterium arthrosphaerae TaxID=651561 RepID=UPI0023E0E669|nr:hypothetical protein [Chryseobacterium arthrosphaerae]WES96395.1 hypothetical protein P2W68_16290 [Chryseobacterium arthrosphaerae]
METRMLLKDESLWNRIQGFSLDAPDADFPFSKKLAKEENWSLDFTRRAIEEYKKFVYLCCILPNGASPSKIIDKVWHMHLIYTQSYWEDFCPNILKKPLHHHPSKGGSEENKKHRNWFADTLKGYQEAFQSEAPQEIWHDLVKPGLTNRWWKKLRILPFFAVFFLLTSCLGEIMTTLGSMFFSMLVAFIFGGLINITGNKNDKNDGNSGTGCGGSSCSGGGSCGGGCGGGCGGCGGCGG